MHRPSKTIRAIAAGEGEGIPLSEREIDVVLAIMAGHTVVRDIARSVGTTETTINNYLHYIYRKAGAVNMSAVILMVAGITPCGPALSEARRRWRRQYYQIDAAA